MTTTESAPQGVAPPPTVLGKLFHRWFVEYNPLYLLSAALVLVGLTLLSRASADDGTMQQELGSVPLIAEAYALSLIGGAALLTRIGLRRPAVMLGFLTVLYQGDLTLLTERQLHLGAVGRLAALAWVSLFVVKIYALAWALRLRVFRGFVSVASAGAAGLALLPHYLARSDAGMREGVVAVWVFGLVAGVLWGGRAIVSRVALDDWQRTVLARSLRATWGLWGMLLALHLVLWSQEFHVDLRVLVPAAALLATRFMATELLVWLSVSVTLAGVSSAAPDALSLFALLTAVVLALRARCDRTSTRRERGARRADGYRMPFDDGAPPPVETEVRVPLDPSAAARLDAGAMFAVWLAAWSFGWSGGDLPAHVPLLDIALTAGSLLFVWRAGARAMLAPLAAVHLHLGVQAGIVSPPRSAFDWGVTAVVLGFTLLVGSLVVGFRVKRGSEVSEAS